jgi:hypothetical protein
VNQVETVGSYRDRWERWEENFSQPKRVRDITSMRFDSFATLIDTENHVVVLNMINRLFAGDVIILRGAFREEWMRDLQARVVAWRMERPSEFHKMVEGSPDFHRIITHEDGLKYAFRQCKHSAYFYRWNEDPLQILPAIDERWAPIKVLMGLERETYVANTPKDGVVDRVQVVRYPPGAGYLEPHQDPWKHQRLFISGYMSKRGQDFLGGGFYLVDQNDKVVDVEDQIQVGDVAIGYATVMHGVAPCRGDCDWAKDDGRWFLSLYSNATDTQPNRHTGTPARLNLPGVLPEGVA